MNKIKLGNFLDFNPPESLAGKKEVKKIPLDALNTNSKTIDYFELSKVVGGAKFRNNDTLVAKITPSLENGKTGKVTILDDDEVGLGSTEFIVLRANKNSDPDFIYYLARSPLFRERAISLMEGTSGRKRVNENTLKNTDFFLPTLSKQKEIASILSTLDDKIEVNKKINQELEQMARDLYNYWFVQFDFPDNEGSPYKSSGGKMSYSPELKYDIPHGWEVKTLEELAIFERGISYTSKEIQNSVGIPMINLASVDINRKYKPDGLKIFSGKYKPEKVVSNFDMLIACTDLTQKAEIIGSPIFVPDDNSGYVYSMDLSKMVIKNEYSKIYLYESLQTDFYHNYIKWFASGTTVKHLDLNGIKWYPLAIPPKKIQLDFSKQIKILRKKQFNIIRENKKLSYIRDELLPMLMNNQISINNLLN